MPDREQWAFLAKAAFVRPVAVARAVAAIAIGRLIVGLGALLSRVA